jgi:hypothetical protein
MRQLALGQHGIDHVPLGAVDADDQNLAPGAALPLQPREARVDPGGERQADCKYNQDAAHGSSG